VAAEAEAEAIVTRVDADIAIAQSRQETQRAAEKARADIQSAQAEAQAEIASARSDARAKISAADALTRAAEDKRAAAERVRQQAEGEAIKQRAIATATDYANRSDAAVRGRAEQLPRGLSYAVTAARLLQAAGAPSLYADISLRNSLGLLARPLSQPSPNDGVAAVSTDARHVAKVTHGKRVTIAPSDAPRQSRETPETGAPIALSVGGEYLATETRDYANGHVSTTVVVREIKTDKTFPIVLPVKDATVTSASFDPKGQHLGVVYSWTRQDEDHYAAGIWHVQSGARVAELTPPSDQYHLPVLYEPAINGVAFSPDGHAVALGGSMVEGRGFEVGYVRVWNLGTQMILAEALIEAGLPGAGALSNKSFDSYVTLYQDEPVAHVALSAEGEYLAAVSGKKTRVWRKTARGDFQEAGRIFTKESLDAVAFEPGARGLLAVAPGSVQRWEATGYREQLLNPTPEQLGAFLGDPPPAASAPRPGPIAGTPDGKGRPENKDRGGVRIINTARHEVFVHAGDSVRVRDKSSGAETEFAYAEGIDPSLKYALSPQGSYLCVSGYSRLSNEMVTSVYALGKGGYVRELRVVEPGRIEALTFSHDETLLATTFSEYSAETDDITERVQLRRTAGWELLPLEIRPAGRVSLLRFSPKDKYLVTVGDGPPRAPAKVAQIRRVADGQLLNELVYKGSMTDIQDVTFSAGERYVATAGTDGRALVWDSVTDKIVTLEHEGFVNAVAISQDERSVATACEDTYAHVWSLPDGNELARLSHDHPVMNVTFSRDGGRLATESRRRHARGVGQSDKASVKIWLLRREALILEACQRLSPVLPADEWRAACGDGPRPPAALPAR
jgi:WD40 repeat protein